MLQMLTTLSWLRLIIAATLHEIDEHLPTKVHCVPMKSRAPCSAKRLFSASRFRHVKFPNGATMSTPGSFVRVPRVAPCDRPCFRCERLPPPLFHASKWP
jgi:hypothetical protein